MWDIQWLNTYFDRWIGKMCNAAVIGIPLNWYERNWAASWENQQSAHAKTMTQISFTVTVYLCFRYLDSTIPLLPKLKISSLQPSRVAVQPDLCQTWTGSTLLGFLVLRLNWSIVYDLSENWCVFLFLLGVCGLNSTTIRTQHLSYP